MSEIKGPHAYQPRTDGHDRWLAMQSAYAEYRRTSEALENEDLWTDESPTNELGLLTSLEGRERAAFESYVEARMAYLEFRFDQSHPQTTAPEMPVITTDTTAAWYARIRAMRPRPNWKLALTVSVVALLGAIAVLSMAREEKRLRDLETDRRELRATLMQTGNVLQLLGRKLEAAESVPHPSTREVSNTAPSRVIKRPATPIQQGWHKLGEPQGKPQATLHSQKEPFGKQLAIKETGQAPGARTYSFALAALGEPKRVGPIKVTLESVDLRRNCANLSIVSGAVTLDVRSLKLNQPLWIHTGDRQQPLELVVDRISVNLLEGRVVEPQAKLDLRASLKPNFPAIP